MGQKQCADFIADRNIAVDHLFTERWSINQADEAYKLFDKQTSGKGVFLFWLNVLIFQSRPAPGYKAKYLNSIDWILSDRYFQYNDGMS